MGVQAENATRTQVQFSVELSGPASGTRQTELNVGRDWLRTSLEGKALA